MATRAIASLSLTFGLVSIPVKVYSATEASAGIRFKLMARGGARLRQQYVAEPMDAGMDLGEADDSVSRAAARRREERSEPEPEPESEANLLQRAFAPSPP